MAFTLKLGSRDGSGEWFTLPVKGRAAEERPELLIRAVPPGLRRELLFRHLGRKQTLRHKRAKGEDGARVTWTEQDLDSEHTAELGLEAAAYALVDARGLAIEAVDDQVAQLLATAAGREVAIGDRVDVAGILTHDLKLALLDWSPDVLEFVAERARSLTGVALEEEDAAGKT